MITADVVPSPRTSEMNQSAGGSERYHSDSSTPLAPPPPQQVEEPTDSSQLPSALMELRYSSVGPVTPWLLGVPSVEILMRPDVLVCVGRCGGCQSG